MGCGASAVQELPQSGPAGSAMSLAKWKRSQQSQTKVVEASLPTSITYMKAGEGETASEAETTYEECSIEEAYSELQSTIPSGEVIEYDEVDEVVKASQLRMDEIKSAELRLQMSKACVLAARSGHLAVALRQVRNASQLEAAHVIAPPGRPSSRRPARKNMTTTSEQASTTNEAPRKPQSGLTAHEASNAQPADCSVPSSLMTMVVPELLRGAIVDADVLDNQEVRKSSKVVATADKALDGTVKAQDAQQQARKDDELRQAYLAMLARPKCEEKDVHGEDASQTIVRRLSSNREIEIAKSGRSRTLPPGVHLAEKVPGKTKSNILQRIRQQAALSFLNAAKSDGLKEALRTIGKEPFNSSREELHASSLKENAHANESKVPMQTRANESKVRKKVRGQTLPPGVYSAKELSRMTKINY